MKRRRPDSRYVGIEYLEQTIIQSVYSTVVGGRVFLCALNIIYGLRCNS